MSTNSLRQKHLDRFNELIELGEDIHNKIKVIPGEQYENWEGIDQRPNSYEVDSRSYIEWKYKAISLLENVLPKKDTFYKQIKDFSDRQKSKDNLEWGISFLKASHDNFQNGFYDDLSALIEAEVSGSYMTQAEQLLEEGKVGKFDHVPAAVLSGAVLEKSLRTLCSKQSPEVPILKPSGEPKTMMTLIDDLKRSGLFNELKASQLRSFTHTRNKAAHGEFTEFTRSDVEQMIQGINSFLEEYFT
jgi:hypothetical protein